MMQFAKVARATVGTLSLAISMGAMAKDWWPFNVHEVNGDKISTSAYVPNDKATKKWNLCVLVPHMKDSFWVATAYGVIEEARRQGVKVSLYQAGGYENLPKQIAQFDDCMAGKADAIITGSISEVGMGKKFREGLDKGVPQIGMVNPVGNNTPMTAKVFVDFETMAKATGDFLIGALNGQPASVMSFPGPQGSGWAESYAKGFRNSLAGSKVRLIAEKYGDTGVATQLKLVEDSLQASPEMNVIWGTAPTAEASIGALREAGRKKDVKVLSCYENQAMLDAMNRGDIMGFGTQFPVIQGRIAVDMAIRALEKKPVMKVVQPVPVMISKQNAGQIDMNTVLAPTNWQPVYSLK